MTLNIMVNFPFTCRK